MGILTALGVDPTVFIHFVLFVGVYLVLSNLLFKPYYRAFLERKQRTVGNQESAERYIEEAKKLEKQYESKAQEINSQLKSIYDSSRSEARKEYDRLVAEARQEAGKVLEENRQQIQKEAKQTREDLKSEIPEIAELIADQLLGKEMNT